MQDMAEASVDSIISDPPYGLSFMGKQWDHGVPGVSFWKEALRVAKPGAMLLAFGGTRTYHRLTVAIEDAGWEIRDCMMWLYGSGFPKSMDISKTIDKAAGAEREVVGVAGKSGSSRSCMAGDFAGGEYSETAPATDAAKLWNGYGTALKPAWEPIIVAMKPVEGTFANNALTHGVAGLNIDACRIATDENLNGGAYAKQPTQRDQMWGEEAGNSWKRGGAGAFQQPEGRWPANVLHDGEALTEEWSRFFYCAKASKAERTCKGRVENKHPTVKPLALMRYLCRLTKTPTGGTVLDPFCGSGSTLVAALQEGRQVIGIEQDVESFETSILRIEHHESQ